MTPTRSRSAVERPMPIIAPSCAGETIGQRLVKKSIGAASSSVDEGFRLRSGKKSCFAELSGLLPTDGNAAR